MYQTSLDMPMLTSSVHTLLTYCLVFIKFDKHMNLRTRYSNCPDPYSCFFPFWYLGICITFYMELSRKGSVYITRINSGYFQLFWSRSQNFIILHYTVSCIDPSHRYRVCQKTRASQTARDRQQQGCIAVNTKSGTVNLYFILRNLVAVLSCEHCRSVVAKQLRSERRPSPVQQSSTTEEHCVSHVNHLCRPIPYNAMDGPRQSSSGSSQSLPHSTTLLTLLAYSMT